MTVHTAAEAYASGLPTKITAKDLGMHEYTLLALWFQEGRKLTAIQVGKLARGTYDPTLLPREIAERYEIPVKVLRKLWRRVGLIDPSAEMQKLGKRYASGVPLTTLSLDTGLSIAYLCSSLSLAGYKRPPAISEAVVYLAYGEFLLGKRYATLSKELKVSAFYLQNRWRALHLPGRKEAIADLRKKWDPELGKRCQITQHQALKTWSRRYTYGKPA